MTATMPATRLRSIDVLRGAVVVLMAIDHVRVFSGVEAGGATPGVFFTRWITHFCAPAFVFLAGTSAWFHARRHPDFRRFLVTRGLWLILLELTVLRLAWTFNFDVGSYNLAGVIWVIGWCMIALAGLSYLPVKAVGVIGVLIIAAHNLLPMPFGTGSSLLKLLYVGFFSDPVQVGGAPPLVVLYTFVPWVGVMAAGYAFGAIMALEPGRRDRLCVRIGVAAIVLFLVLRGTNVYGDMEPWSSDGDLPASFSFLNATKYPASLSFLLMTLGPTIALIPFAERASGWLADALQTFGRVPFFYYVLHLPLIHLLAVLVSLVRTGAIDPWLFANHPMGNPDAPAGYVWSLGLLYLVWAVAVVILYFACRWYAGVKARSDSAWLKYL